MAEYRDCWEKLEGAGADVAAISVDPPERAERVRRQLRLPFLILCDSKREVVRQWGVFEPAQFGGIAKPAVFVLDGQRRVRLASIDREASRVPASAVADFILQGMPGEAADRKRRFFLPQAGDWLRAGRNILRFGMRAPRD